MDESTGDRALSASSSGWIESDEKGKFEIYRLFLLITQFIGFYSSMAEQWSSALVVSPS